MKFDHKLQVVGGNQDGAYDPVVTENYEPPCQDKIL